MQKALQKIIRNWCRTTTYWWSCIAIVRHTSQTHQMILFQCREKIFDVKRRTWSSSLGEHLVTLILKQSPLILGTLYPPRLGNVKAKSLVFLFPSASVGLDKIERAIYNSPMFWWHTLHKGVTLRWSHLCHGYPRLNVRTGHQWHPNSRTYFSSFDGTDYNSSQQLVSVLWTNNAGNPFWR